MEKISWEIFCHKLYVTTKLENRQNPQNPWKVIKKKNAVKNIGLFFTTKK